MQGDAHIIGDLNQLLTGELTAMDVYFVQSRVCQNWGYDKLWERLAHEVTDETRHADALIQRILFLGGHPDMASRVAFEVGETVEEMMRSDLDLEIGVAKHLNEVMARCEAAGDNGTRSMLEALLDDTEHDHIRWFEAQLKQISDVGIQNYLQAQL